MLNLLTNLPRLPTALMHNITALIPSGEHDILSGGQYIPSKPAERVTIQGIIMPLSNEDWKQLPIGAYTEHSAKLYTNGETVKVGAQIIDEHNGQTYTVTQELTHGPIHPMKRYMLTGTGEASAK